LSNLILHLYLPYVSHHHCFDTKDEESNDKKKDKTEGESSSEAEKKSKGKQMIKVGAEYIKRVEVQYCELCKVYLPRSENTERAVALHCSTRSHLKRYFDVQ